MYYIKNFIKGFLQNLKIERLSCENSKLMRIGTINMHLVNLIS